MDIFCHQRHQPPEIIRAQPFKRLQILIRPLIDHRPVILAISGKYHE
tara:strand:- start:34 stop:174 length:141 start_codon:yes stop_codon:yes gene_type:complete